MPFLRGEGKMSSLGGKFSLLWKESFPRVKNNVGKVFWVSKLHQENLQLL